MVGGWHAVIGQGAGEKLKNKPVQHLTLGQEGLLTRNTQFKPQPKYYQGLMPDTADLTFRNQLVDLLPRMRRFAYTLTSNMEDADDLVQAACERALNRRHQWRQGTRLDHWLFRIIYTQRVDMTRSQRSRHVHVEFEEKANMGVIKSDSRIEANIMLRQVMQAMKQLPESDRVILALICIEGFSYKESAATLKLPLGTVMSRLARARRRLHELVHTEGKSVYQQ